MRVQCLLLLISLALIGLAADAPASELAVATELELKGDPAGAERVLLGLIKKAEGAGESGQLGVALNNLAVLYVSMERHADAERYFKSTIRMMQFNEGEAAKYIHARVTLHLAWLYIKTGRVRDAEKLNVLAISGRLQAPDDQARARSILASLAMFRNDLTTAEDMFLGVLSFWQSCAPQVKADAEIATTLNNLGMIAWRQGRTETALSRLHQSLALWRGLVGPDNPTLAKTISNIAIVYSHARRYGEATEWQQQAVTIAQRAFGDMHPFTIAMLTVYAEALKKAGRRAEAARVSRSIADARRSVRSPSIADYAIDYRDLR